MSARPSSFARLLGWLNDQSPIYVGTVAVIAVVSATWGAKAAWDSKADRADLEKHVQEAAQTKEEARAASEQLGQLGIIVADDHEKVGYLSGILYQVAIARGLAVPPPPASHPLAKSAAAALKQPVRIAPLFTTSAGP